MLNTHWPIKCPNCPEDVRLRVEKVRAETMMLCPACGAEMTANLQAAQQSFQQAEQMERTSWIEFEARL